jgi:Transposase
MGNCAGVDWASEKHDVLIEDPAGEELLAATFAHDEDGVSALCAALACFEVELVAIERPDGLLVDKLLEAGVRVLALHPNQVKATRDRFRASGGKSDQFDRFVLCELARTDSHRFRILEPDCDQTKGLRALVRAREDLVGARVALEQPAARRAWALLARPDRALLRPGQPDLARVPGPLSQPGRRAGPR